MEYIQTFPAPTQIKLQQMYDIIKSCAPDTDEAISYGMPTFRLRGKNLVYFAAFEGHLGFYATPTGHEAFKDDMAHYKHGKGSVRFPLEEPLPKELIIRMTDFRVNQLMKGATNDG